MSLTAKLQNGEKHVVKAVIVIPGGTELFVTRDQDMCLPEALIYPKAPDVVSSFELPEGVDSVQDLEPGDTLPGLGKIVAVEFSPSAEVGSEHEVAPPPWGRWVS